MDTPNLTPESPEPPQACSMQRAGSETPLKLERRAETGKRSGLVGVGGEHYDEITRKYHREYMAERKRRIKAGEPLGKIVIKKAGPTTRPPKADAVHYAATLRLRAGYYAESKKKATMNGSRWGEVEDALVMDYTKTARELANALGRTFFSVLTRRAFLRRANSEMGGGGAEPVAKDSCDSPKSQNVPVSDSRP